MKLPLTLLLSVLALITTGQPSAKKSKAPIAPIPVEQRLRGIEAQLEPLLNEWKTVGFAVGVVYKDKVIYEKGFGYRDLDQKLPVTPNTLFAIGSCTKAFTDALLGQLQNEGKLDFDQPVTTYLPQLRFFTPELTSQVTVRDMMSHRTGIPRHDGSWYYFPSSRDSLLRRMQYMEPAATLRQKFLYNNFMYMALGALAEQLTGQSWESLVRERILNPLKMENTNLSVSDMTSASDASLGYRVVKDSLIRKEEYYNSGGMSSAGSINSSVAEMTQWVKLWINGGKLAGREILSASYIKEAMSSQMVVFDFPYTEVPDLFLGNYGMGWMMFSYKGHFRVEHGGNINGFSAYTSFFPTDSIGIVVLANQGNSPLPYIIENTLADRLLNAPAFDWNGRIKQDVVKEKAAQKAVPKPNVHSNTLPSHSLDELAGTYTHPGYGSITLYVKDDSLLSQMKNHKLWYRHVHYDIFEPIELSPDNDPDEQSWVKIQFTMNPAGDIDGFNFDGIEPALGKPIVFKKVLPPAKLVGVVDRPYEGDYEIEGGEKVSVFTMSDKRLFVILPGQPEMELIPIAQNRFMVINLDAHFVTFIISKNEPVKLEFEQPIGKDVLTRK